MSKQNQPVAFSGRSVTVACTDLDRSRHFYVNVLGAKRLPGDGYGCPWYKLGSITISLMPNAELTSPSSFPKHAMPMLWLEVEDIELAHNHLKNSSVEIIDFDHTNMMVADPDGLHIEIWQKDAGT